MPASPPLFLVSPVRTPIGKFGGALASLTAADLGTAAATACLERAGVDPAAVSQTIFGHARQAGGGPNTARQISHRCGLPVSKPAFTVNQACGSGMQAVLSAARTLLLGEADLVLAGGTESMSNTPYLLPRARWGYRLGHAELTDGMYKDGFCDPLSDMVMGETAEVLADRSGITRADADRYAARSQTCCEKSRSSGRFRTEIVPVTVQNRKSSVEIVEDEHPREGVTEDGLAKLKPVFREGGTVTAGNASGITDGAAASLVASESAVEKLGLEPVARILDWEVVGVEPEIMGIGPVPAIQAILERNPVNPGDLAHIEINEAFASQVLACVKELPFDLEQVNPDGGAIALGHPIGCTGARIITTLVHGLSARNERLGIASLCVSGGMGLAVLVERVS